jgi:hypothetical protein
MHSRGGSSVLQGTRPTCSLEEDKTFECLFADSELGIVCPEGEQPALIHMFAGVYDLGNGTFDPVTTGAMADQYNDVLDFVRGIAGIPVSAVSTVADADPASPSSFVCPSSFCPIVACPVCSLSDIFRKTKTTIVFNLNAETLLALHACIQ